MVVLREGANVWKGETGDKGTQTEGQVRGHEREKQRPAVVKFDQCVYERLLLDTLFSCCGR